MLQQDISQSIKLRLSAGDQCQRQISGVVKSPGQMMQRKILCKFLGNHIPRVKTISSQGE